MALLLAEVLHSSFGLTRLSILFLAAVTVVASLRGARSAIVAALVGVFFYKLFLDLRTPDQTDIVEDVLNIFIFLIVALITGALAGRLHDAAETSKARAERTELLFDASRALTDKDEQDFWQILSETLSGASGGPCFVVDHTGSTRAKSGPPVSDQAPAEELAGRLLAAGDKGVERAAGWSALLISSPAGPAGVLAWQGHTDDPEFEGVVRLLAELASAYVVRAQARQEQIRIRAEEEANRLREALLSSISHDFRSPLAAIIGSATSLLEYGDRFDSKVTRDLLLNIQDEGEKLNQFVGNLLNMTRLQAGVVNPTLHEVSAAEIIDDVLRRIERHSRKVLQVRPEGDCLLQVDRLLLEQAIYNVIDNAVKYGSGAEGLEIRCERRDDYCDIVIADQGPGIPEEDQLRMFDSFHFARSSTHVASTGLGLSIARGFVNSMGGTIGARNRIDGRRGLEVVITLRAAG